MTKAVVSDIQTFVPIHHAYLIVICYCKTNAILSAADQLQAVHDALSRGVQHGP